MTIFKALYDKTLAWSSRKNAVYYLFVLSFIEAIFFPIPPDVMLAPMVLAKPEKVWRYAGLTAVASVLGGIIGYILGEYAFEPVVRPFLEWRGYHNLYQQVSSWFLEWGFWVMLLAGITPIPYKVFTVAAGTALMPFSTFVFASMIGRGIRFYGVGLLVRWGGPRIEPYIIRHVDYIGWFIVIGLVGLIYLL